MDQCAAPSAACGHAPCTRYRGELSPSPNPTVLAYAHRQSIRNRLGIRNSGNHRRAERLSRVEKDNCFKRNRRPRFRGICAALRRARGRASSAGRGNAMAARNTLVCTSALVERVRRLAQRGRGVGLTSIGSTNCHTPAMKTNSATIMKATEIIIHFGRSIAGAVPAGDFSPFSL